MTLQLRALGPPCSIIHVEEGDKGCVKSLCPVCEVTTPIPEQANVIFTLPFATNTFEKPLFTVLPYQSWQLQLKPSFGGTNFLPPEDLRNLKALGFGNREAAGDCWEAHTSEELSDSWRAQGFWLDPCWLCSMVERVWYACCRFRWFLRRERPPPAWNSLCRGDRSTDRDKSGDYS